MTTLPPEGQGPEQPQGAVPPPPGAPQNQAPQYQYQPQQPAAAADPFSNVQMNYWLSVFFAWLPALIFWMIDKDKGDAKVTDYHRQNLNFSLIRTGVMLLYILTPIPVLGWIIAIVAWLGSLVLAIMHLITAIKAPEAFRNNQKPPFMFNFDIIK